MNDDITSHSKDNIYVVELRVPSHFYPSSALRYVIPNPAGFGISKGYWIVRPPDEQSIVKDYSELIFMIEFVCSTLKDAENHAIGLARMFNSIASAYGGYPLGSPYLNRIASVGANGGLIAQHDYCYRQKPYMSSMFDQTVKHQFQKYLQSVSSIDGEARYQLQSAIQWYGIAVTADDPMVSYVAAWIGLECIGNVMNSRFHPNGPKVSCRICGNIVGNNRNRKMAGINHIFNLLTKESLSEALSRQAKEVISSELQEVFSFDYARKLRNDSVHPAERIETILQECSRFRRHLFHVLNASILGILGQSTESWITGDYQFHPDARVSLKFYNELEKFPYHGEWMGGLKYEHRQVVWNQGEYHPAGFEFERSLDERTADLVEYMSGEIFRRKGDGPAFSDKPNVPDRSTWHDRLAEPVWEKVIKFEGSN